MQNFHSQYDHSVFDLPQTSRVASVVSYVFVCSSLMVLRRSFEPGTKPHKIPSYEITVSDPVRGLLDRRGRGNRK